jgi:hypothetical protein
VSGHESITCSFASLEALQFKNGRVGAALDFRLWPTALQISSAPAGYFRIITDKFCAPNSLMFSRARARKGVLIRIDSKTAPERSGFDPTTYSRPSDRPRRRLWVMIASSVASSLPPSTARP